MEEATRLGVPVIDRCNLTVLLESGQEDLGRYLAFHHVRVVASMPCYSKSNVDSQRGAGNGGFQELSLLWPLAVDLYLSVDEDWS